MGPSSQPRRSVSPVCSPKRTWMRIARATAHRQRWFAGSRGIAPGAGRTPRRSSLLRPSVRGTGRRGRQCRRRSARRGARALAIAGGWESHSAVEPSMSDMQNVMTPLGSEAPSPRADARRARQESPAVGGIGRQPEADAASSCSAWAGRARPCGQRPGGCRRSAARTPWPRARIRRWPARGLPAASSGPGTRRSAAPTRTLGEEDIRIDQLDVPPVRIRLPGLTSPWITGEVSCADGERRVGLRQVGDHATRGAASRPRSRSTFARSVPSTQSIATT